MNKQILDICVQHGVSHLWMIGSRSRGEEAVGSDYDFMMVQDDYTVKTHKALLADLSKVLGNVNILTLMHVVSRLSIEEQYGLFRDAVPLIRKRKLCHERIET